MFVCFRVCLFYIEIQTAGQIWMKFGTEVVLEGGKVLGEQGGGSTQYPPPRCIKGIWGVSEASTMRFGKNFMNQKLQGTPVLVGAGHLFRPQIQIWKDLGPMS